MKVMVTGTAGFIGNALAIRLLERGDEVLGVDNLNDYYDVQLKRDRLARIASHPGFRDARIDIEDLAGRALHDQTAAPDEVFVQISESQIGRALRTATHTYAVKDPTRNPLAGHRRPGSGHYVETHLYDNGADPDQQHNLVKDASAAGIRRDLAERLATRIAEVEGSQPTITSR